MHVLYTCVWRSEDNFQESILPPCGFGDRTQVVGLGSRRRDPLSHLGSPHPPPRTIQTSGSDQTDEEMNGYHHLFMALHRSGPGLDLCYTDVVIY